MGKKLFLLSLFLFSQFCFGQKVVSTIDLLQTEADVQNFVRSCSKSKEDYLSSFELKTIGSFNENYYHISEKLKKTADSLGIDKSFYKGDFDHNGRNDLIFIGDDKSCQGMSPDTKESFSCNSSVKVIFDMGNDYIIKNLLPNHFDFIVPVVTKIDNKDYISVFLEEQTIDPDSNDYRYISTIIHKTLDYKTFNSFIEYNPDPKDYSIQKIVYETGMCFGTCPMFKLELNKNGKSTFIAKVYNFIDHNDPKAEIKAMKKFKKGEGTFEATIKESDFQNIENLLNYIDFPELKNEYSVNWTDDHSSLLTITYNNGQVKKIDDYGLVGTYGLKKLYNILFDLRFSQNWKKIK